jgi:ubiquinone/menaquinone biosynthesis C-methylase UbiE
MSATSLKFKMYYEYLNAKVQPKPLSDFHEITSTETYDLLIKPLKLKKTAKILEIGSGPGYFLDILKKNKFKNVQGIVATTDELELCKKNKHNVRVEDHNFIDEDDESKDFIICRNTLETSPFPFIALMEYNRILKQKGQIYIEMSAPMNDRNHESRVNYYSLVHDRMIMNWLVRAGFDITVSNNLESTAKDNKTGKSFLEKSYGIVATKQRPIDVK